MPEISVPQQAGNGRPAARITVAMPVLNGGRHLKLAVQSIVAQTYGDWELLLIDDGSTDNALQGIEEMHDPRIRILRDGRNKGLAARLNEAIDLARGEFIARMDHDDVSYPERFAHQIALLETNPELDVVAVESITISDDNDLIGRLPGPLSHRSICARPWQGFYFPHPTWLGRTTWFRTYRYGIPGPYLCEDQELLLRSHANTRFATVDRVLFAYRMRSRISVRKQFKTRWTLFNIQWRYFILARRFDFAIFSAAAFSGRIISDLWKVIRQSALGEQYSRKMVDSAVSSEWQDVLKKLLIKL